MRATTLEDFWQLLAIWQMSHFVSPAASIECSPDGYWYRRSRLGIEPLKEIRVFSIGIIVEVAKVKLLIK
jgi:hypothetical protein